MSAVAWEPHTLTTSEVVEPGPVTALAALFDDGLPTPEIGDQLPPLWHWAALPRWPVSGEIGGDGHPRRGSFLPPVRTPPADVRRRQSGRVSFAGSHRRYRCVELRERRVGHREGRPFGPPRGGRRRHPLLCRGDARAGPSARTSSYRESGVSGAAWPDAAAPAELAPGGSPATAYRRRHLGLRHRPVILDCGSPLPPPTPSRIHYDWPYATRVEGYPGLVVHGPLMTLALAEVIRLGRPDTPPRSIVHRNRAPLFCGQPASITVGTSDEGLRVELFGPGGADSGARSTVEATLG